MKSYSLIIILICLILFVSFVSAESCLPEGDYKYCDTYINNYETTTSIVKLQLSDIIGVKKGEYFVDNAKLKYKFEGDEFYLYDGSLVNSWDDVWYKAQCNEYGCGNFIEKLSNEGELNFNVGESYTACPVFIAWDKDSVGDDWSWTTGARGWIDNDMDGSCLSIKVVDCYTDDDCNIGEFCDRSSDSWQEFSCKKKECYDGQDKCMGMNYYLCEDDKYVDKGLVKGECYVECIGDKDCSKTSLGDKICLNYDVYQKETSYSCINNMCKSEVKDKLVEDCSGLCVNGACEMKSKEFSITPYLIWGIGIVLLILLFLGLIRRFKK